MDRNSLIMMRGQHAAEWTYCTEGQKRVVMLYVSPDDVLTKQLVARVMPLFGGKIS